MNSKPAKIFGWVLSIAVFSLLALISARAKLTPGAVTPEMLDHIGYTADTVYRIGIVEAAIGVLFVLPRVNFIGALLLTAYLDGATATHVRIEEAFYQPIVVCTVAWIGLVLRRPELLPVITGTSAPATGNTG